MPGDRKDSLKWRIGISLALIVLFIAAGAGLFLLLLGMKKGSGKKPSAPPRTVVRTETAQRTDWRETLTGYGLARALRSASVAAEVPGVIDWISPELEAGAFVEAGEQLVRIRAAEYEEAVASAKARRDQAAAARGRLDLDLASVKERLSLAREDLDSSERELARIRGLVAEGVVTESELDRQRIATSLRRKEVIELANQVKVFEKELERAVAEVEAARAAWERARIDVGRTKIAAPFDGRIEERRVSRFDRVAPGAVLFTIVDLARTEVPVALGASRFGEVVVGASASLSLREGGPEVWSGEVARISPTVNAKDRTFMAYLVVSSGSGSGSAPVPPGAFVVAEIAGPSHARVIPVPRTAFVEDRIYVAAPEGDDTAIISVCTPEVSRWLPSVALVTGGIEEGALIVVTNIEQIADGSRVQLVREGERSP